jgi:hypothetical protein
MRLILVLLVGLFFSSYACAQTRKNIPFIKGVYGNPAAMLKKGHTFKSLGINAVFVHSSSLDTALFESAKKEDVRVFVEFPTFNGQEYLKGHPEAWPITPDGKRAEPADWFMGICLTDPGFRKYRTDQLKTILDKFAVDGIWLDYVHWHAQFETPDPILPETCFCNRCTSQFSNETAVLVPEGTIPEKAKWILSNSDSTWRSWRSKVLTTWVRDLNTIVKNRRPTALLGIYYCPWFPSQFNSAHYRILGLDLKELAPIVDVFSPMVYHKLMGESPEWVAEYCSWLGAHPMRINNKPSIWPIVQADNKAGTISAGEFLQVMENGAQPPSGGVMMFHLNSLFADEEKLEVMRHFYLKR